MISALLFLQYHSLRNRLQARVRRLKNPKYLAGAIIGALYLIFYFGWLAFGFGPFGASSTGPGANDPAMLENVWAAGLLIFLLLGWVLPNDRAALAFTEAEVAFLFPAPITRKGLIHYKLIRSQTMILFSTIFLTLVFGRWRYGAHVWISLLGWWTILSTMSLHGMAGSFARTMLFDRGITNLRRRILILGLLVLVGVIVYQQSASSWPRFPPHAGPDEIWEWVKTICSTGIAPYVLAPFRLVVKPYFATDTLSFIEAWIPALGIMAVHYFLVVRADVAFEEASVAYSQKLATRIESIRERRIPGGDVPKKPRRAPFALKPTGLPSIAFLWKNLILAGSFFSLRMFFRLGFIVVIFATSFFRGSQSSSDQDGLGFLAVMLLLLSVFWGQNLLRADFRSDLNSADILKTYPLPGWQVVLGEILAPVVVIAAGQWLLIVLVALLASPPSDTFGTAERVSLALSVAIILPAIDLITVLIPNAVALLMPSWVRFDKNAPRGFENFGQNIIIRLGQMLVLMISLIPAGLAFWAVFAVIGWTLGPVLAPASGALAGALVLVGEAAIAIYFLGHAFERFDLTAETIN